VAVLNCSMHGWAGWKLLFAASEAPRHRNPIFWKPDEGGGRCRCRIGLAMGPIWQARI
jgi:hypothetical protein